jgi:CspA family cold shock protein
MRQIQRLNGGGPIIEATVKWFSTAKGFGFVAPTDGSPEAFLHMGAMEAAGLPAPQAGATIKCEIGAGKKGPQVMRVVEAGGGPPSPPPPGAGNDAHLEVSEGEEIACTVRWYCPVRGYGFLSPDDGTKDIFVSSRVLERSKVALLNKDQRILGVVIATPRGREARGVRLM